MARQNCSTDMLIMTSVAVSLQWCANFQEIGGTLLFFMLFKSAILCDLHLLTSFLWLKHLAMQTFFYHLPPHIFFNNRCSLKGGYAIQKNWTTIEGDSSAACQDIGARNGLKLFQVDQPLKMLQASLVTILAREMRLKCFWKSTKLWRRCQCR